MTRRGRVIEANRGTDFTRLAVGATKEKLERGVQGGRVDMP